MKSKFWGIILIGCLLVTSLFSGGAAYAQDEGLPDPGLTPDSPFYFLDGLGKNIGMFFTFGNEAKARKALQYAEERLAEARAMADKDRVKETERAASEYDKFISQVQKRLEEAGKSGASDNVSDNISERVALATARHLAVLDSVKDRVPEKARDAIARAIEASKNGQVDALKALGKNRPEKAIDIAADIIKGRLERAKARASDNVTSDNVTGDVEEALDYADRLAELQDEMAAIAQEKGIDITALQQHLAQATSHRLEVLSGVYNKVPEKARHAIENAIENSLDKYQRAIDKLQKTGATGNLTDSETVKQHIQKETKDRLHLSTDNRTRESEDNSDNHTGRVRVETKEREQEKERTSTANHKPEVVSANHTGAQKPAENREETRSRNSVAGER